jgi:hypothetical protein
MYSGNSPAVSSGTEPRRRSWFAKLLVFSACLTIATLCAVPLAGASGGSSAAPPSLTEPAMCAATRTALVELAQVEDYLTRLKNSFKNSITDALIVSYEHRMASINKTIDAEQFRLKCKL